MLKNIYEILNVTPYQRRNFHKKKNPPEEVNYNYYIILNIYILKIIINIGRIVLYMDKLYNIEFRNKYL